MSKFLRNKKIIFCSILPDLSAQEIDFEKFKEIRGLYIEDPLERVKSIFSRDDFGNWHPELINALLMAQSGALGGFLFGGTIETIKKTDSFIRTNDTNIYLNKRYVYRELVNQNLLAVVKGGLKWCPSFALFCGSFSLISSCCELYRNKSGLFENIVAGSAVGAMCKFMFGFKGMIAGGIIGGIIGTIYGSAMLGLKILTRSDHLELKYAQFSYSLQRKQMKERNKTVEDKEMKKIVESGLHNLHINNPLNFFNDENQEEKKSKYFEVENDKKNT